MRDASDECIEAFAAFVERMSRFLAEQASGHGLAYVETSGMTVDDAVETVIRSLLGESNMA